MTLDEWLEAGRPINKIINCDCLEGMKHIDDKSVDLVLTDLPYGINYKSNHGSDEYKKRLMNFDWDKNFNFKNYFYELKRLMKDNTYMYVFGRLENMSIMLDLGVSRVLIWDKEHNGMGNLTDWGIGYEFIYAFKKGKPKLFEVKEGGGQSKRCHKIQAYRYVRQDIAPNTETSGSTKNHNGSIEQRKRPNPRPIHGLGNNSSNVQTAKQKLFRIRDKQGILRNCRETTKSSAKENR